MLDLSEAKIERDTCTEAYNNLGVTNVKLKVTGKSSLPDRLFWIPGGKPLLIEFKRPGCELDPGQADCHRELEALGYEVQVHDNTADAFAAIIAAVEARAVSKASSQILARARRRCAILRSRTW